MFRTIYTLPGRDYRVILDTFTAFRSDGPIIFQYFWFISVKFLFVIFRYVIVIHRPLEYQLYNHQDIIQLKMPKHYTNVFQVILNFNYSKVSSSINFAQKVRFMYSIHVFSWLFISHVVQRILTKSFQYIYIILLPLYKVFYNWLKNSSFPEATSKDERKTSWPNLYLTSNFRDNGAIIIN